MKQKRKSDHIAGLLILALFTGSFLVSCSNKTAPEMLIVTRVPVSTFHDSMLATTPVIPGSALIGFNPAYPEKEPEMLTGDFYSACTPHVAYDGKRILFLGQKTKDDPWQVWEMDLMKKTVRKVTDTPQSCFTPYYLPGDKVVFSREMPDTGTGIFYPLFTMNLDGSDMQQITFHPAHDLISTILNDGRILLLSAQVYPEPKTAKCLALRPNGTKMELFYGIPENTQCGLRVHEAGNGLIWFTEKHHEPFEKWDLISIRYNRPLHSAVNHTGNVPGDFYSLLPAGPDQLYVSYRAQGSENIGLYAFSVPEQKPGKELLADAQYDYLDPVRVQPYERPKNLPNELMSQFPTGLLMSQNVNITQPGTQVNGKASAIEVLGMDHSLGIVQLEDDGSFYLKIPADMPFRIQTIDVDHNIVVGPSDWYWVRSFERRGCIGCHEDPELSPQNIVPQAIRSFPVVIPVDTSNQIKKEETFKVSNMK